MTYCVAMKLDTGLVFLADSRTNAGVDQISTFRKMAVFEQPGERVLVLMSAGNLAITQAVVQRLCEPRGADAASLWQVTSLAEAAHVVGDALRAVHGRDGAALKSFGIEFNASFILGGQIGGEAPRLFRPPQGVRTPMLRDALSGMDVTCVTWSARGLDTIGSAAETIVKRLAPHLQRGAILLREVGRRFEQIDRFHPSAQHDPAHRPPPVEARAFGEFAARHDAGV